MTEEKKMLFSQDALKKLLWPLIIEQFLAIAMGMADTVMAASCGEAVVSGISLVDSICVLLIGLFTAMASGGAVVAAQYMGHGDKEMVGRASNQLFLAVGGVALLFMTIALIWNKGLLALLYGNVEADVMNAARIYFYIVAVSFPFLGIYNGGAALFRGRFQGVHESVIGGKSGKYCRKCDPDLWCRDRCCRCCLVHAVFQNIVGCDDHSAAWKK